MVVTVKRPPNSSSDIGGDGSSPAVRSNKRLSPTAQRALAEAQARRAEIDRRSKEQPVELCGRDGPDPARYGDWEVNGIASDF